MGLTKSGLDRFRRIIEDTLMDVLPVSLRIAGEVIAASSPGGKMAEDYMAGGKSPMGRSVFRVPKSAFQSVPIIGSTLEWLIENREIPMEIESYSERPHESLWIITCITRRV
jgi:hypothetical protein